MQVAISAGDIELVKQLMALGATIECPDPNQSYLMYALTTEMKLFLLNNGTDLNKIVKFRDRRMGRGRAFFACLKFGKGMTYTVQSSIPILTAVLRFA